MVFFCPLEGIHSKAWITFIAIHLNWLLMNWMGAGGGSLRTANELPRENVRLQTTSVLRKKWTIFSAVKKSCF